MISARPPDNETQRLAALKSYAVLDTNPELAFDDITALAAMICETPVALISLIDAHRQWFKSNHGLITRETARDMAFCAHTILQDEPLVVNDCLTDARFRDNPLITAEPHIRFYAGTPLINPEGFKLGTLCVVDYQPRSLTDSQLQALQRLGRQVIAQLELSRARDAAQSAAHAKSEFLANMSHEIRTPLNGVIGIAHLLAATALSHEQRELVLLAQRSGEHLLSVVNNILDFSRLEAGYAQIEHAPFNLHELVLDVIGLHRHSARDKGIKLQLNWHSARSPHYSGDAQRLRQLLINFVGNAIKFTERGSVTIEVDDGMDNDMRIAVRDTGIGIAPEFLPRVFERFTQADGSSTRKYGGTGLGLAIAAQLVRIMGGRIGADSHPGEGSCFWCEVPLLPTAPPAINVSPATGTTFDLRGRSVLIAEDDAVNMLLMTRIMQRMGAEVVPVVNGAEAVAACRLRRFDLILMDGMMPVLDGFRATEQIRDLPGAWTQVVPVIALTAGVMDGDRECCLRAGMSDYLTKPVEQSALEQALRRALEQDSRSNRTDDHTEAARLN